MTIGVPVSLATTTGTASFTTGASASAGSLLVISFGVWGGSPNVTAVTDSAGNSYSSAYTFNPGTSHNSSVWYCSNCLALGSGSTVSFTTGGGTAEIKMVAVSGANGGVDISSGTAISAQTTYSQSTGILANASEIIFGGLTTQAGTAGIATSEGNGFTSLGQTYQDFAYLIVSSTASVSYNPTWNGTVSGQSVLVSFQATASGTTVTVDFGSPVEAIAASRSDAAADAELLASLRSDIIVPTEIIAKAQRDTPLQQENLGALAVTGDAALQLEIAAKLSADANTQAESSAAVLASSGAAIELLIKVTSDRAALGEALAALSASPVGEVEITVGVQASAAEPVETSVRVTVDRDALIESLAGVSRDQGESIEVVALTAGVTGNAALALEILGGLALGSPVSLEIRGNSFILGRLLKNMKIRVRSLKNQKVRVRSLSNTKTRN